MPPPEPPTQDSPAQYTHGPTRARRIPRSEIDPTYLQRLQANGRVQRVAENWSRNSSVFPPDVTWVMYPNGDLERLGFN
jgi:hypothetical protein